MLLNCTIISYLSDALLHCTSVTHYPLKETSVTGFQNNTQGTQISFQNLDLIHLFKKVSGFVVALEKTLSIRLPFF